MSGARTAFVSSSLHVGFAVEIQPDSRGAEETDEQLAGSFSEALERLVRDELVGAVIQRLNVTSTTDITSLPSHTPTPSTTY